MKSLLCVVVVGAMMAAPINAQAPPAPAGEPALEGVELFQCVCYKDLKHVHPCAVPRIVMVPDPCACNDPCNCCEPKCVAIQICVPPPSTDCCCETVEKHTCSKNGKKQKYDFGKYEVEITVKKGVVIVDYDN